MILSRVAESCYWLHRYVERADDTARLLRVNRAFVLDMSLPPIERWHPLIVVAGEHERFSARHGEEALGDGERVQEYMTWDEQNPVSILSSVTWARENARTIREVISREMWETFNTFYQWLKRGPGRRTYTSDREAFYLRVQETAALFHGTCDMTMLHLEPFDFMRLGMHLERANQTARIIDIKHHALSRRENGTSGTAFEVAQAAALLRSCSATEPYLKRTRGVPAAHAVVDFLLHDRAFPRALGYGLAQAAKRLEAVRPDDSDIGIRSDAALTALRAKVARTGKDGASQLHEELTEIVDDLAALGAVIHEEFFAPSVETHVAGAEASTTIQTNS